MDKIPEDELKDWQDYLNNPAKSDNSKINSHDTNIKKIILDLHEHNLDEAFAAIKKAFATAEKLKLTSISIITGIGKYNNQYGKLYQQVPYWLDESILADKVKIWHRDAKNQGIIIVKLKM